MSGMSPFVTAVYLILLSAIRRLDRVHGDRLEPSAVYPIYRALSAIVLPRPNLGAKASRSPCIYSTAYEYYIRILYLQ